MRLFNVPFFPGSNFKMNLLKLAILQHNIIKYSPKCCNFVLPYNFNK